MKFRPKDRIADLKLEPAETAEFNPEIKVIQDETKLDKPTLEAQFSSTGSIKRETDLDVGKSRKELPALSTYFVEPGYKEQKSTQDSKCASHVAGVYCTCNKVNSCSCVGYSGSSSGGSICRCVPVH